MARDFEITVSQQRTLNLFGLTCDGSHTGAKLALLAAGLTEDGIPSGQTWRSMKKLSDDELRAAFGVVAPSYETERRAASIEASRNYVAPSFGDRIRAAKARERQNDTLRAAGYRWQRIEADGVDRYDAADGWELVAADGRLVTVDEAMAEIEAR